MWLILLIGQLGLVFGIMFLIARIPSIVALGLFFVYALTMGLVLGVIVYQFTYDPTAPGNISQSGMAGVCPRSPVRAAIFGGAAVYGFVTKRDLTKPRRHPLHGPARPHRGDVRADVLLPRQQRHEPAHRRRRRGASSRA